MSKRHGAREQKKLAKQKAKRDAQRRQVARQTSADPNIRLHAADRWPIVAALVPDSLWDKGMGQLVFARRMPDGQIACAAFLLDTYCLGVKNAFWSVVSNAEFDKLVEKIEQHGRLDEVSPEYFSKLVHCAADYAQSLGFPPHCDFRHARLLLAGIDPSRCKEEFEFGKDGRPLYIQGPHESPDRVRSILARLDAVGGHYVVPLFGEIDLDDFELDDDFDEEEEGEDEDGEEHIIDV